MKRDLKDIGDLRYYEVTRKNPIIIKLEKSKKERLFHYTSEFAAENIYNNGCMWITQWNYLDDKEELKYISNILKGSMKYLIENKFNHMRNTLEKEVFLEFNYVIKYIANMYEKGDIPIKDATFFLLSLTERKNNKYLIENYSKKEGKIIDINKKAIKRLYINKEKDCLILEGKVIYDCTEQLKIIIKDIEEFYTEIINNIISEGNYIFDKNELRKTIETVIYLKVINYAVFFKRIDFKKEEEYRIAVLVNGDNLKESLKFRKNEKDNYIPYVEVKIDSKYLKLKSAENIK